MRPRKSGPPEAAPEALAPNKQFNQSSGALWSNPTPRVGGEDIYLLPNGHTTRLTACDLRDAGRRPPGLEHVPHMTPTPSLPRAGRSPQRPALLFLESIPRTHAGTPSIGPFHLCESEHRARANNLKWRMGVRKFHENQTRPSDRPCVGFGRCLVGAMLFHRRRRTTYL